METAKKEKTGKKAGRKARAKKGAVKGTGAEFIRVGPDSVVSVASGKGRGVFAKTVHGALHAAGRLASTTRRLGDLQKAFHWRKLSSGTKEALDSTKQQVFKIGVNLKNAVEVEKVSAGAQKAWDLAKQGAHKAGESFKNTVKTEQLSAKAKTVLDSTKAGLHKISGGIQKAVKVEKISKGAQKAWSATRKGATRIGRGTTEGLAQIGESFKAGYQAFGAEEKVRHEAPVTAVAPKKVLTPSPSKKIVYSRTKSVLPKVGDTSSNNTTDDDLEKEVDEVVSGIDPI